MAILSPTHVFVLFFLNSFHVLSETLFLNFYLFIIYYYLFIIYLVTERERERERERGRDIGRGRSRLHAPGARCGIRSRVSRIAPGAKGRRQTAAPPRDPSETLFALRTKCPIFPESTLFGSFFF